MLPFLRLDFHWRLCGSSRFSPLHEFLNEEFAQFIQSFGRFHFIRCIPFVVQIGRCWTHPTVFVFHFHEILQFLRNILRCLTVVAAPFTQQTIPFRLFRFTVITVRPSRCGRSTRRMGESSWWCRSISGSVSRLRRTIRFILSVIRWTWLASSIVVLIPFVTISAMSSRSIREPTRMSFRPRTIWTILIVSTSLLVVARVGFGFVASFVSSMVIARRRTMGRWRWCWWLCWLWWWRWRRCEQSWERIRWHQRHLRWRNTEIRWRNHCRNSSKRIDRRTVRIHVTRNFTTIRMMQFSLNSLPISLNRYQ